jgi:phage-related minor tail protein
MGHAIEDLELEALDRLTDGLADASTEFLKLGGVAGDVLNSIIGGLVKLAAQQEIFGKTGSGGLIGSIGGLLGIGGGAKLGGVNYGAIGQAANSVRLPGFDTGGYTGDGPRKQVAGVVHKGEYVVPAEAVKRIGVDNLAALSSARAASAMAGVTAAAGGQAGGVAMVRVELTDDLNGRIAQVSGPIAVSVVKQNAPAIAGAGATAGSTMARERMTRTARNRIPG